MKTIAGKITITEAAKILSVSRQRMHKIICENGLLTELVHPRLFLIHPKELEKIRQKNKTGRKTKNKPNSC
jgi:phage antirepressor YoqD-like protein